MKKNWVKKIKFLKEYLSIIILFPATIGGLWQVIELASISPSYIRFFSISQVVPDGLLVLLFIACILITFFITRYLFQFTTLSKLQSEKWLSTFLWMIPIVIMFSVPLVYRYFGIIDRGYIEVADIFTFIGCLTIMLASFANLIPNKKSKLLERKNVTKSKIDNNRVDDNTPKLKNYLFAIGFFTILILSLKLFGLTTEVIGKIRDDSVKTDRLINLENLIKKLKTRKNFDFLEILYVNDKYIFVQYLDSNNKKLIEVMKYEKLFE